MARWGSTFALWVARLMSSLAAPCGGQSWRLKEAAVSAVVHARGVRERAPKGGCAQGHHRLR